MTLAPPRHYRLTRPDGLGFFHRRSLAQFLLGVAGLGFALLALVMRVAGLPGRLGLAAAGVVLLMVGLGRTPSGEEFVDLVGPLARFGARRVAGRHHYSALLAPWEGPPLPPLFAGITLAELAPDASTLRRGRVGLVVDRADGTVTLVLRMHGEVFLLAEDGEQAAR